MGTIIPREKGNNTYYVYQETYREKINKKDFAMPGVKSFLLTIVVRPQVKYALPRLNMLRIHPSTMISTYPGEIG